MNEAPNPLIALVAGVLIVVLGLAGLAGLAIVNWLVIWPVERRAQATKAPFRFRLIDLGCLLVYWQVILAAAVAMGSQDVGDIRVIIIGVAAVAALLGMLVWGVAVNVLARAGIESSVRRAAFILLTLPMSLVTSGTTVISGSVVAVMLWQMATQEAYEGAQVAAPLLFAGSMATVYVLRLISLWIAADARAP